MRAVGISRKYQVQGAQTVGSREYASAGKTGGSI